MRNHATMLGLWIVRTTDPHSETLLGIVQSDLYLLAFTSAVRANTCMRMLGATGSAFYLCSANVDSVVRDARASQVRGFIVDYDPRSATFSGAWPLPERAPAHQAAEARR